MDIPQVPAATTLPLMPLLADETLFSWISRHHALWGSSRSTWTASVLFDAPRGGSHHDLPNRLAVFVQRTAGVLGPPDHIALTHTLLGFFKPFLRAETTEHVLQRMCGESVAHVKYRMGLLTSRFGASHPLKCCSTCLQLDIESSGWTYWHLSHQLPGVWFCPQHQVPLHRSQFKATGVQRFGWLLPAHQHLAKEQGLGDHRFVQSFSAFVLSVWHAELASGSLHLSRLAPRIRALLRERDLLTPAGNVRQQAAAMSFLECCGELRLLPDLRSLPSSQFDAERQLGRLLRRPRGGTHPLRTLALLFWLLPTERLRAELLGDLARGAEAPDGCGSSASEGRRDRVLPRGEAAPRTATKGPPRPKKLRGELRAQVVGDLRTGVAAAEIANRHCLSLPTVYRLLRGEPALATEWRLAALKVTRAERRKEWISALRKTGGGGVKRARVVAPAAFGWLYRNDRAWLAQHSPSRNEVAKPRPAVDWVARDRQLHSEVSDVIEKLRSAAGTGPVRLWQICREVPELRAKRAALHRLPLTQALIQRCVRPNRSIRSLG